MKIKTEKIKSIDFWNFLKEALALAWKKKYLWWLGFFASIGSSGGFNFPYTPENNEKDFPKEKFLNFFSENLSLIIILAVIALIIFLAILILSIIAKGALIKSIAFEIDEKKLEPKKSLGIGKKYFWKILFFNLFFTFSILVIMLLMAVPIIFLFLIEAIVPAILLIFIALLIFIPIAFLINFLFQLGIIYLVLGELSIWQSIDKAYRLWKNNILESFVMLLIFFATRIFLGMAFLITFLAVALVFLPIVFIFYLIFKTTGLIISISLGVIVLLAILFAVRGFYEVFRQTTWIKFFLIIAKPKLEEKVLEKIPEPKKIPTTNVVEEI